MANFFHRKLVGTDSKPSIIHLVWYIFTVRDFKHDSAMKFDLNLTLVLRMGFSFRLSIWHVHSLMYLSYKVVLILDFRCPIFWNSGSVFWVSRTSVSARGCTKSRDQYCGVHTIHDTQFIEGLHYLIAWILTNITGLVFAFWSKM